MLMLNKEYIGNELDTHLLVSMIQETGKRKLVAGFCATKLLPINFPFRAFGKSKLVQASCVTLVT